VREAYICDTVRTPIGRYGGALRDVRPDDLGAVVLKALSERLGTGKMRIDDVWLGCSNQAGEDNRNVARMSALLAGLPIEIPGVTVNRLCGSGMQAVISAAQAIQTNSANLILAGGVESMTRSPWVLPKIDSAFARGPKTMYDTTLGWRMVNPSMAEEYPPITLGETADNVADQYGVSREDQDRFALASQEKAAAAMAAGRFEAEIVPVSVPTRGEPIVVSVDEHPRPTTTLAQLAKLKPAFRPEGTVTAGNSSGLNDGAAAVVVCSGEMARCLGLRPRARIISWAAAGVHPSYMGIGPVPASRMALDRVGLTMDRIDLVEINEAFAAQCVASIRELGIDEAKVNVNGGAIALGHPLGCSGARIIGALVHELERRGARYGLATMCIGVGQGITTIVERV
jgi:3-oxoadipyl-CoA thiolase